MSFYEIYGLRNDAEAPPLATVPEFFGVVGLERNADTQADADAKAYAVAEEYAAQWSASVQLYRVPDRNTSSVSSFDIWPGQMHLITTVPAPPCPVCGLPFKTNHRCDLSRVPDDEVPF